MERDLKMITNGKWEIISTHTLTWSVTTENICQFAHVVISTHTLTWSVTLQPQFNIKRQVHFNSHAHVERDR